MVQGQSSYHLNMGAFFSKVCKNHPFHTPQKPWFHTLVSYMVSCLGFIPSCFIRCFICRFHTWFHTLFHTMFHTRVDRCRLFSTAGFKVSIPSIRATVPRRQYPSLVKSIPGRALFARPGCRGGYRASLLVPETPRQLIRIRSRPGPEPVRTWSGPDPTPWRLVWVSRAQQATLSRGQ